MLPPGLFVVIFAAIGLWQLKRKKTRSGLLFVLLALLFWGLSIEPTTNFLMRGLEAEFDRIPRPAGDVVILLGGGVYAGVSDLTGRGYPGPDSIARIVTAVRLHKKLAVPVIVSGGRVYPHQPPVATVLKRIMVDLGVDPQQIILEDRSRDTFENAKYSKEICVARGFTNPIVTTSAYHLKRARLSFEQVGMQVKLFPAYIRSVPNAGVAWNNLLPHHDELHATTVALHEYLGLIYYRMIR